MILQARHFRFSFPGPTLIMGVLNVTPDSFSDGGQFLSPTAALSQALLLAREGADIIDIGGESTRPNAPAVSSDEELRRVLPVVEKLASQLQIPLSIDTSKPEVARACLQAGASLINDTAANRTDPEMWGLVAQTGAGYVAMHMQGTPQTMQLNPSYIDVVQEIDRFFEDRLQHLQTAGVHLNQVILDVGLGFGKSQNHNLRLLTALQMFTKWNRPLLIGASRKSFIGNATGQTEPQTRLPGSIACACWAVRDGVNLVRTHDVAATRQALLMTEAIAAHAKIR